MHHRQVGSNTFQEKGLSVVLKGISVQQHERGQLGTQTCIIYWLVRIYFIQEKGLGALLSQR